MFILQQPVAPVGGPPRILNDHERGDDNTTNTGRVFQHQAGGAQPVQQQQPPQIGGPPPAGPRAGDGFVPALGVPGQNQDPQALAVINLLKDVLRAVGPDGTLRAPDGTQISVKSILDDPANQPFRADLNNVIEVANRQRADLQDRILQRTITLLKEVKNENKHQDKINQIMQRFVNQEFGLAQNPDDPSYVDVVTPEVVYGRVLKSSIQEVNSDPNKARELAIRLFLIQEAEIVDNNFKQEIQRTTREPYLISNADIRQIFQNVNNNQEVKNLGGGLGDGPPTVSDDAASEAVWRSIQTLEIARKWPALVAKFPWLAKIPILSRSLSGLNRAGQWLATCRAAGWLGTATRALPIAGKPLAWCGARAIPGLNIAFLAADNLIDIGTAFHTGKGSDIARAAINTGFTVGGAILGAWIPVVGPVLGAIVGNLVGKAVAWLTVDGGAKKIWNFCKEHIPAITKPLEIIAKPFVKAWEGVKSIWKGIFG